MVFVIFSLYYCLVDMLYVAHVGISPCPSNVETDNSQKKKKYAMVILDKCMTCFASHCGRIVGRA